MDQCRNYVVDNDQDLFYLNDSINIMAWLSNYIHGLVWVVIIHPCLNVDGGLIKLSSKMLVFFFFFFFGGGGYNCMPLNTVDVIAYPF